jgi:signal transduction histidine kinase
MDALNESAYAVRYKQLDSCEARADRALALCKSLHSYGAAEAMNHRAFVAFMRMNFRQSAEELQQIYDESRNELEKLVADVGMMRICQRTSQNKEFYDYKNQASQRMQRIREEYASLNEHERERFTYAVSEFHIVTSIYDYYLQQGERSLSEINLVNPDELSKDTAQWLYYQYMKGSGGLCEGANAGEVASREFEYLLQTLRVSRSQGYLYFEANAMQALAEWMLAQDGTPALDSYRKEELRALGLTVPADSLFPMSLAQEALQKFKQYQDVYQIAGTYRTLASCLIKREAYAEAVDTLQRALDYVNFHHERYFHCVDQSHRLLTYNPSDTLSMEKQWLTDEHIQTIPEWIARIREQLCIAYSGLGDKAASDYNRNIYLDILEETRLDKEWESRYDLLESEQRQLDHSLWAIILVLVVTLVIFGIMNKRWRKKNNGQTARLKHLLEVSRKIPSSLPIQPDNLEVVAEAIRRHLLQELHPLFEENDFEVSVEEKRLVPNPSLRLTREKRMVLALLSPYVEWTLENGSDYLMLGDRQKEIEKEHALHEQHIAENKRQNEEKKACLALVNGITPYLDRMIREVRKLLEASETKRQETKNQETARQETKKERYQYIRELIDRINEYNDMLALWIKMKQGKLSLNIESFALNELFTLQSKRRKTFESKQLQLLVEPTEAVVKADKALTLFMVNTLAENARKFTPEGGTVRIYAEETPEYVEISVQDTGIGLSPEDVQRILGEKVYDASSIGMQEAAEAAVVGKNKGSGFGLINSKGIIEKYRKTNALFQVCCFNIESEKWKGSRFYFRLPKGVIKSLMLLLLLLFPWSLAAAESEAPSSNYYDDALEWAAQYADSAYYSNINGRYAQTLQWVDSAMVYLNAHRALQCGEEGPFMQRAVQEPLAEIVWWRERFDTDYHVILDIRNEAAVAALALKAWNEYRIHNTAYTQLYKFLSEEEALENYSRQMQYSANDNRVSLLLLLLVVLALAVGCYLFYFRRRILSRFNLLQVQEINREVMIASLAEESAEKESVVEEGPSSLLDGILQRTFYGMNDLFDLRSMGVIVTDREGERTYRFYYPEADEEGQSELQPSLQFCLEQQQSQSRKSMGLYACPLTVGLGDESHALGAMALLKHRGGFSEEEQLLAQLVAGYLSSVIWNVVIRRSTQFRNLELAADEKARAQHEENRLHVQNQVLDNCLSTIKHETLYYPNRIRQLVETLAAGGLSDEKERELLNNMSELLDYYKSIFTLLSACAERQMEQRTFLRESVSVEELMALSLKYNARLGKRLHRTLPLETLPTSLQVIGDRTLLAYLLENLLQAAYDRADEGLLSLSAEAEGDFVRLSFTDSRGTYTQEELNQLFYPDLQRMTRGEQGEVTGTAYLICKQIVRDHDEYTGFRGCRINAEVRPEGGFTLWFTLPKR